MLAAWTRGALLSCVLVPVGWAQGYGLPLFGPSRPAPRDSPPLTLGEKFNYYLHAYEPEDFLRSAFWAGVAHLEHSPEEWRQGAAGYGRRFASRFGTHTVRRTIQFGIGAVRREDPRWFESGKRGFLNRTGYALSRTLLVRNDHGRDTVAVARITGSFGAGLISNTWQPSTRNSLGDGLTRGATTLAGDAVMNMVREFWPEIRSVFSRRSPDEIRAGR